MRMGWVILALQLSAAGAAAQTAGDPVAGRQLAAARCSGCHAIAPERSGQPGRAAPAFSEVARMPSTTALALQAFLRTPHAEMPDLVLTPAQLDDVVAYILSLRAP